jgi:hypothetical protein
MTRIDARCLTHDAQQVAGYRLASDQTVTLGIGMDRDIVGDDLGDGGLTALRDGELGSQVHNGRGG